MLVSSEEVRQRVRTLAGALAPMPQGPAASNADLIEHLRYDSVALMELTVALEQEFELPPLEDSAMLEIRTVGEIEALVCSIVVQVSP